MSAITIAGNTSGSVTLAAPDVAGTTTLTLPATSGTVMVNGPAFSANSGSNSAPSLSTWTKVTATTVLFDTNSAYSSSRFTPTVAGYYLINASAQINGALSSGQWMDFALYKNGVQYGQHIFGFNGISYPQSGSANLVYLNGTGDYVELYFYTTQSIGASKISFGGFLARSA